MSKSKANLNQRAEHLLPRRSRWRFRLSPSPRLPSRTRIKSIRSRLAWLVPLNTNSTAEYGEASAGLSLRTCAPAASGPPLRRFTMERAALAGPLFSSISADTLAETQIRRPSHARHVCRGTGWPQPSGTRADGAPMAHQVTKNQHATKQSAYVRLRRAGRMPLRFPPRNLSSGHCKLSVPSAMRKPGSGGASSRRWLVCTLLDVNRAGPAIMQSCAASASQAMPTTVLIRRVILLRCYHRDSRGIHFPAKRFKKKKNR